MTVVDKPHTAIVQCLLPYLDPIRTNKWGDTALQRAIHHALRSYESQKEKPIQILKLLLSHPKGKINTQSAPQENLVDYAIYTVIKRFIHTSR